MNKTFLYLFTFSTLITSVNCAQKNTAQTSASQAKNDFITGQVAEIQRGKDGFTAKIITSKHKVYFATISRANLTDPSQYRSVNTGESIQVKGDLWKMGKESHITVRQLK
ncbi:hypothetical protein SAMN04515674_116122 [Pseudarcicella hirudinis]|uniref:DUF5666 domain-containing protein n=1 Tax=Pseudarcicella hirudinis TaxID=1079859 RepID=A0A1I5Y244_9BACT|nr:hypothetical protein [Pseudarcicella hirudinis]SFQ38331.1 hypothetical protein SAMN04515674_116122 [Pseudarcicella hirudinis]